MAPNGQKYDSPNVSMPEEGDVVSWKWAGGQPQGKVVDVKTGETQISTKNGNTVARHGTDANPAMKIVSETTGSTVLKKASEIDVQEKHDDKTSDKASGEKRSKPANDTAEKTSKPEPKKLKLSHADSADGLEDKLEGKGLTKEDKELVKEHVDDLTKEDMKQPVSRRTRRTNKRKMPVEAELELQLFES